MSNLIYVFIGILLIVLLAAHFFFYKTLVRFLVITKPAPLFWLKIILGFLSISLVLATIVASRYFNFFSRIFYIFSAAWLGMFYYLIAASLVMWLCFAIAKLFSFALDTKSLYEFLFLFALLVAIFGIFNADIIRTTRVNVKLPNLPAAWQGKTAVWVSDLHLGQVRNYGFAQKIANMIEAQKPDIVFIGGDLYDGAVDGASFDLNRLAQTFGKIPSPLGIYFITGNHEEFSDPTPYLIAVKNAGIKVLFNEKVDINGLQIIGVDDRDSLDTSKFPGILEAVNIDKTKPSILLKHTPFNLDIAASASVSMQISGHTHLGQIFPNSLITSAVYSGFDYGLRRFQNMFVYVSSGVGTWGPPMRVGAAPEIAVVKFE